VGLRFGHGSAAEYAVKMASQTLPCTGIKIDAASDRATLKGVNKWIRLFFLCFFCFFCFFFPTKIQLFVQALVQRSNKLEQTP
jgi:hypothetical protein